MAFVKNKFVRSYSINSSSSSIQTAKIIVNKKDIEKIPNFSSISGSDPILDNNLDWNPSIGDTLDQIIDSTITISSNNRFIQNNNNCKVLLVDHGLDQVVFTKIDPQEPIDQSYFDKNDTFVYYVKFFIVKSPSNYDTILIYPNFNIITNVDNTKIKNTSQTYRNKLAKKSIYNIVVGGVNRIIQKTPISKFKEIKNVAVVKLSSVQTDTGTTDGVPVTSDGSGVSTTSSQPSLPTTNITEPPSADSVVVVVSPNNNLTNPILDNVSAAPQIPPSDTSVVPVVVEPIGGGAVPLADNIPPQPPTITTKSGNTKNNILTVFGNAEPNSTVFLYANSLDLGSVSVDANGLWSIVTGSLPNDEYLIFAVAVDANGNISDRSDIVSIVIDTTVTTDTPPPITTDVAPPVITTGTTTDTTGTSTGTTGTSTDTTGTSTGTTGTSTGTTGTSTGTTDRKSVV